MRSSEATFDDIMQLKLLQEEYADVRPLQDVGVSEAYSYLVEAEVAYYEICKTLAQDELKLLVLREYGDLSNNQSTSGSPINDKPGDAKDLGNGKYEKDGKIYYKKDGQWYEETKSKVDEKGIFRKFIDMIKNFFKKIGASIASIWHWFVSKWDTYVKSYESFADKYGKELDANTNVTFEGMAFPNLKADNVKKACDKFIVTYDYKKLKVAKVENTASLEPLADAFVLLHGARNKPTPDSIKNYMYGEKKEQEFNIGAQLKILREAKGNKKDVSEICTTLDKNLKLYIETFDGIKDEVTNKENVKIFIDNCKGLQLIFRNTASIFCKGVVLQANQAKAICIKALQEKRNAKDKEGTTDNTNKTENKAQPAAQQNSTATPATPAQNTEQPAGNTENKEQSANAAYTYSDLNFTPLNEFSLDNIYGKISYGRY